MLSVPSPARTTYFRLGAASTSSGVTLVAERMTRPEILGSKAFNSSWVILGLGWTSRAGFFWIASKISLSQPSLNTMNGFAMEVSWMGEFAGDYRGSEGGRKD